VRFTDVFPQGAYALAVDPLNNYEQAKAGVADPQERDKDTGERMWIVRVLDPDPLARAAEVKVKIPAPVQPVPPETLPGTPLRPVEFDGLTVTPWVDANGKFPKQGLSFRATGMRSPGAGRRGGTGGTVAA
jgi:hypothetical protein